MATESPDTTTGATHRGNPTPPSTRGSPLRTLWLGIRGGGLATAVMTLFRMPITDSLPPTAEFWARYVGDGEPEEYPLVALLLHFAYGIGAGTVFAAVFDPRTGRSEIERERRGTVWATLYGLGLSVFGSRVLLERLLGMALSPDERWIFHVSHVVYGTTLGAWLGSTVSDAD